MWHLQRFFGYGRNPYTEWISLPKPVERTGHIPFDIVFCSLFEQLKKSNVKARLSVAGSFAAAHAGFAIRYGDY
jgi:hypothetical protein